MEDEIETFQGVTGADRQTARDLLEAHNGDLNNAINYFLEHGTRSPNQTPLNQPAQVPTVTETNSDEEEPVVPLVRRRSSRPTPQASIDPFGRSTNPAAYPFESPFDEEELPPLDTGGFGRAQAVAPARDQEEPEQGGGNVIRDRHSDEQNDVEEEMMKAALEASMKEHEAPGAGGAAGVDDDLEMAITQSLKTAEQEQQHPPALLDDVDAQLFPLTAAPRAGPLGGRASANGVSGRRGVQDIPIEGFDDDDDEEDPRSAAQQRRRSSKGVSPNPNGRVAGVSTSRGSIRRASPSPEPRSGRDSRNSSRSSRRRPSSEERAAEMVEDVHAFVGRGGVSATGSRPNRQPAPVGNWPPRFPSRDSDKGEQTDAEASVAAARAAALGDAAPAEELDPLEGLTAEEREEAHMLEAAMMGIPYEAPAPAYNPVAGPAFHMGQPAYRPMAPAGGYEDMDMDEDYGRYQAPRELDPMVQAQRDIRNQQDEEYLVSLAADREKELKAAAEAEERSHRERREQEQLEAEEARKGLEERQRLEAEEALQLQLAQKASALPAEPPAGEPGVVTVMVRMPDGSRKARRLRSSDPVQVLFDSIDVENSFKSGSYRLVNSFPRRVLEAEACKGKTLADVGLTSKQEALFLEQ